MADSHRVEGPGVPPIIKTPISHGTSFSLLHEKTLNFLHSHPNHRSPTTQQQECTAFGPAAAHDSNDNWRLEKQHGAGPLHRGERVFLVHANTGMCLHSHNRPSAPTRDQFEVTCYRERNDDSLWEVEEFSPPH